MTTNAGAASTNANAGAGLNRRACLALAAAGVLGTGCGVPSAPKAAAIDWTGWRVAGEFEPTKAIWLGWDAGHVELTATLVRTLAPVVPLRVMVTDEPSRTQAEAALRARGVDLQRLRFVVESSALFFTRDVAVFLKGPAGLLAVADFAWTSYGMAAWCAHRHGTDREARRQCEGGTDFGRDELDRRIAAVAAADLWSSDLAIEGGGIEFNGKGLALVSEPYLRSRNPGLDRDAMERALLQLPGMKRVIWLAEGAAEDPLLRATVTGDHVAWGTGGHTDEFVRFTDANTVLLCMPEDADRHPVAAINRQRMRRNLEILQSARDAEGRPLRVLRLPMPRPIERPVFLSAAADNRWSDQWTADDFPAHERRWQGQRVLQVAAASYANFLICNDVVLMPDYRRHGTPAAVQERVAAVMRQALPGRRLVWIDVVDFNWVGGGPHCATLNEPA